MLRRLMIGGLALCLAPLASAEGETFELQLNINQTALSDPAFAGAEFDRLHAEFRRACTYSDESVLANQVDSNCVSDLMHQVTDKVNHENLNAVYRQSLLYRDTGPSPTRIASN